jgi:hypothetical protein
MRDINGRSGLRSALAAANRIAPGTFTDTPWRLSG